MTIKWTEASGGGGTRVLAAQRGEWRVTLGPIGSQVYATLRPPAYLQPVSRRFAFWADAQAWAEAVLLADPKDVWTVAENWKPTA